MTDLNKFGIGLTVLFSFSLLALLTELTYLLWFRRRQSASESGIHDDPPKHFLYFFPRRNHSRVEPTETQTDLQDTEPESCELEKWQEMYGPSRVLYTIKEEEREDLESEKSSRRVFSETQKVFVVEEEEEEEEEETVTVTVVVETPFSTPCSSPSFYSLSPSPSPSREK